MTHNLLGFWPALHRVTRGLVFFAAFNLALGSVAPMALLGTPRWDTTWGYAATLRRPHTWGWDSWRPMGHAYRYLTTPQAEPRVPLYTQVFFTDHVKFIYPPSALLVWEVLAGSGLSESAQQRALNLVSGLSVVITALAAWRVLEIGLARQLAAEAGLFSRADQATRAVVCLGLAVTYFPVVLPVVLGQIQTWINALTALMVWLWLREKQGLAGALAGAMTLIKPQTSLLLLWGLLRGERRFSAIFAGTLAIGLLVSTAMFGVENHLNYLSVLSYISSRGESYLSNQSVNGLLNRLLHNGPMLHFATDAFAPYHPLVYAATVISSVALVGLALYWPARSGRRGDILDICTMLLTATMASPTAWQHHYGPLVVIYAALIPVLLRRRARDWKLWTVVAASYVLTSNHLAFLYQPAVETSQVGFVPVNLVLSHLFIGALLVLGTLYATLSPFRAVGAKSPVGPDVLDVPGDVVKNHKVADE